MEKLRKTVRQELTDAGWLVTSKDAIKFGAHFLLYKNSSTHSVAAVLICLNQQETNYLLAQRFSRLCESVGKTAILVVPENESPRLKYIKVERWIPNPS